MKWLFCKLDCGQYMATPSNNLGNGIVEVVDFFDAADAAQARAWVEKRAIARSEELMQHFRQFGGAELWRQLGLMQVKLERVLREGNAHVREPKA